MNTTKLILSLIAIWIYYNGVIAISHNRVPQRPRLTFFCEVKKENLSMVSDPNTIKMLAEMNAAVSVAMMDYSKERADFIKLLNLNNIKTTAWLLVNHTYGYWANLNNVNQIESMYIRLKKWGGKHNVTWSSIGLDLEIDLSEITPLEHLNWRPWFDNIKKRYYNRDYIEDAKKNYTRLVQQIKADNYNIESYIFPFIHDERKLNNTFFQTMFAVPDIVNITNEIPMLYTSGLPKGKGFLKSYGKNARAVAVGSTGGDPMDSPIPAPYENWELLRDDLLYAYHFLTPDIYIYSLQGSVKRNFVQKIHALDWSKPLKPGTIKKYDAQSFIVTLMRQIVKAIVYFIVNYIM
jgi:hypothetical protein